MGLNKNISSIINTLHTRIDEDMRNVSSINRKNTFNMPREYSIKIAKDGKRVKEAWLAKANRSVSLISKFLVGVVDGENKVVVCGEPIITNSSRGLYACVYSFDSKDGLYSFIDELSNCGTYKQGKDFLTGQDVFDVCVYRGDSKKFITLSDYMDYMMPIISKNLDNLSTLFCGKSLLDSVYGEKYIDLHKCKVIIGVECQGMFISSPVIVNCYCVFTQYLTDLEDSTGLELQLESMNNLRFIKGQYVKIEYMRSMGTLIITF